MSFDTLARHYRWMEFVLAGEKLQRSRKAFLDRVGAHNILVAGEGNGRFLVECRRRFPAARITVVDASARILEAARRRLARRGLEVRSVDFVHANILAWDPPERAHDLVVTHFFLDCFPAREVDQVVATLARATAPGADWLLADFQLPAGGWRRRRAQVIHALMYAFFRVATRLPARRLVEPDKFLKAHGFVLREKRTSDWELLCSEWWTRRGVDPPHTEAD